MSSEGSVSRLIHKAKAGEPAAFDQILARFFQRLVGLARKKFAGTPHGMWAEDAVQSALKSFWKGVAKERFGKLDDRADLWRVLCVLTDRKARRILDRETRQKRGGGRVRSEPAALEALISKTPSPEFEAIMKEEVQRLLDLLGDQTLQLIAVWRMEDYTDKEIADRLNVSVRTVERKLARIRDTWSYEVEP